MTDIVKTEAIVLKSMKYGESSKIVTFYTKEYGKIKGIVKGARKAKSKFGSALETFSYVQFVMYKKENRSLHLVSQCDILETYKTLTTNLEKLAIGLKVVELIDKISHDEERNTKIFKLVLEVFHSLEKQTENLQNIFCIFEVKLIELLGYQLSFDRCGICKKKIFESDNSSLTIVFDSSKGSPICSNCNNSAIYPVNLSVQNCKILDKFETSKDFTATGNIVLSSQSSNQIRKFLFEYLRYHISELKDLKSEKIFNQII
jgi:DNA repair protein RecO (recombination protein O)